MQRREHMPLLCGMPAPPERGSPEWLQWTCRRCSYSHAVT